MAFREGPNLLTGGDTDTGGPSAPSGDDFELSRSQMADIGKSLADLALVFDNDPTYSEADAVSDIVQWSAAGTAILPGWGTAAGAAIGIGVALFSNKEDEKRRAEEERKRREAQKKAYEQYRDKVSNLFYEQGLKTSQMAEQQKLRFGAELSALSDQVRREANKYHQLTGDISTTSSRLQLQRQAQRTEGEAAIQARVSGITSSIEKAEKLAEFAEMTEMELEDLEGKEAYEASAEALKEYRKLNKELYG